MKLMRVGPAGQERPAVMVDGVIRDVSAHIADYDGAFFASDGLARLRVLLDDAASLPMVETSVRVGAPIARPHQVLCIGLNYADHARESGMAAPAEPIVFNKAPNTVVGPDDDVLLPPGAEKVDWEVELGVVIGKRARYLASESEAHEYVAGYVLSNDVSERAYQLERGGQWVKGKSAETFNPLGPWVATRDEIADPGNLALSLVLNGEKVQDGSTSDLIFGLDHIVWYLSQFMVLEPGDLINTGTPAGVGLGFDPPVFLKEGDVMELEAEGLGRQRQTCRRASR